MDRLTLKKQLETDWSLLDPKEVYKQLSWWQQFVLWLRRHVCLGKGKKPGWTGELPIYLCKCEKHGLYLTNPSGYQEQLTCHTCFDEWGKVAIPESKVLEHE